MVRLVRNTLEYLLPFLVQLTHQQILNRLVFKYVLIRLFVKLIERVGPKLSQLSINFIYKVILCANILHELQFGEKWWPHQDWWLPQVIDFLSMTKSQDQLRLLIFAFISIYVAFIGLRKLFIHIIFINVSHLLSLYLSLNKIHFTDILKINVNLDIARAWTRRPPSHWLRHVTRLAIRSLTLFSFLIIILIEYFSLDVRIILRKS